MNLQSCAVVLLVCLTLSDQAAVPAQWPPVEWRSNPYAQMLYRFMRGPVTRQSDETPAQVKVLESETAPPTLPPRYVTSPTLVPILAHHPRPTGPSVCESMICPPGTRCHPTFYQCSSPPCPVVAECKAYIPVSHSDSGDDGVCGLPVVPGNCSDSYQQWYWSSQERKCVKFFYSGCHGNANRFPSETDCLSMCDRREQLCRLVPETGMCRAAIPRFYYNVNSKRCERFIYGGCNGNSNNFQTEKECAFVCSGV